MDCRKLARLGLLVLLGAAAAALGGGDSAEAKPLWASAAGRATAPAGYLQFCRAQPAECVAQGPETTEALSVARWSELVETNTLVNLFIAPLADIEQYRREEVWALPGSAGDCEDYVLLKRKWLIDRGWPTASLLISVVYDEVAEGHAVLVARTDHGDFVLDNKTDEIRRWTDTPYRFVKRQSAADPNRWVAVSPWASPDVATAAPAPRQGLRGRLN